MSLLWQERRIHRAVAGELSGAAELRLHAHLRRCDRCRTRYDQLSHVAAALASLAGRPSRVQAARARARLTAALPATAAAPARQPRRQQYLRAFLVLAPIAVVLLWLGRPSRPSRPPARIAAPIVVPADEVRPRGSAVDEPDARGSLVVYAARKLAGGGAGPLRVVAELPASGQGRVSLGEYVAFGVRNLRAAAFVTVAGVQDDGAVHLYLPRPAGARPRAEPGPQPTVFRPSINLAHAHHAGRLTIYALISPAPLDPGAVRQALASGLTADVGKTLRQPTLIQVSGLLTVEP